MPTVPLLLSGHERALTQVIYNLDGDLLFSCSKDHVINVWLTHNGERLGTYAGHKGTVWTVAVDSESRYLVSGSADNQARLWDVRTGKCVWVWEFDTAIKRIAWSEDDSKILLVTEERMGHKGAIRVFPVARESVGDSEPKQSTTPSLTITNTTGSSKATVASFVHLDQHILSGHEDGSVSLWDANTGELEDDGQHHQGTITDLQVAPDGTWAVTSSKDKTAHLIDTNTLKSLKTFPHRAPLNSAAIVPTKPYVLIGGGQEAMNVTTTAARQGYFDVHFWHRIFEEEVAKVKGGFGPCNTLAVHPKGEGYALGGEDGYVRLFAFDEDFTRARPFGADMEPDD